jgi:hypothetical protein
MDPLPVVKPLLHQFDDVRDGFRRFFRIGLKRKRAFGRFDDDHRTGSLSSRSLAKSETAEYAESADQDFLCGLCALRGFGFDSVFHCFD